MSSSADLASLEHEQEQLEDKVNALNSRIYEIKRKIQLAIEKSRGLDYYTNIYEESAEALGKVLVDKESRYYQENYQAAIKAFREAEYQYAWRNPKITEGQAIEVYLSYRWLHMSPHWENIKKFARVRLAPDYVPPPPTNDSDNDYDVLIIPDGPGADLLQAILLRRANLA